jgi:alcohol dehydrogenase class IV
MTDSAALEGIRCVASNIERVFDDGTDRRAREAMSLGSLLGGIALHARMVYGHSIGYTIATRFKLPHGVSCALPLPYIIANYSVACAPKMKRLADAYGIGLTSDDPVEIGLAIAQKVKGMVMHLKLPTTLKELGVKEEDIPLLANECVEMYSRPNSPLVFDGKSMNHFYQMMWEGSLTAPP